MSKTLTILVILSVAHDLINREKNLTFTEAGAKGKTKATRRSKAKLGIGQ